MKSVRVLLVDDNEVWLSAAKRFLRSMPGLRLAGQANSGKQAVELAAVLHPDLVLMDFAMPGMNGAAATRQIKRQPDAPKVVIVTLMTHAEIRTLAEENGADGILLKENLVAELPRMLDALFPGDTRLHKNVAALR